MSEKHNPPEITPRTKAECSLNYDVLSQIYQQESFCYFYHEVPENMTTSQKRLCVLLASENSVMSEERDGKQAQIDSKSNKEVRSCW